jgi:cytochrome P450
MRGGSLVKPWFRWLSRKGALLLALRTYARRGDPLAQLMSSPASLVDPHPLIETIRQQGRLVATPLCPVTAEHDVCRSILRDNQFGWRTGKVDILKTVDWLWRLTPPPPPNPLEPPSMLVIDPPEHTRMRHPVSSAFTPRAIGRLRERVETVTAELLETLPAAGPVDLITSFASQVPAAIITDMLGFPDDARSQFLRWGSQMTPMLDTGIPWRDYRDAVAALEKMDAYLDRHIAQLRRAPGDDILSSLATGSDFDDRELKVSAGLLMIAGFQNTVNLIGNGVVQLLAHPEQLARLREDPDLWPNAIEEILRFDPPVHLTSRAALSDVEVEGVGLRTGNPVVLLLAGANRDPNVFPDADRFDITRRNAKEHLSFSSGIHSCLGASLARMEGTYALRALFERFPDLQLAGPPQRGPLFIARGYSHLPITLGRRAAASSSTNLSGHP